MKLDIKNKDRVRAYQDFVKAYGHFQQDMRWADLKENWESAYFYKEKDGKIIGALSLIYIKDGRVGKNFFYGPRGPVCDLKDIGLVKELIGEALDFARANERFLLRIDPLYPYDEDLIKLYEKEGLPIHFDKKTSSQPLLNMVLDLKGRSPEEIFEGFSKNTRKHLRKSYRDEIVTKTLTKEGIDILYDQVVATAKRAGIGHRPRSYFYKLYELFKDEIRLSACFYEGSPLCSSLLLVYGDRATSLYGGSSDDHKSMGQNYQLNFEEISYCAKNGINFYDMGGIFETDGSDGLYNFKRKFTGDSPEKLIGEIDMVIDGELYKAYMTYLNPHFEREKNESN